MSNDETIEMFSAKTTNPMRVNIPKEDNAPESVATVISPAFSPQTQLPEQKSNWAIIGVLSGLLILVLLGFAGFAAYVFFKPESNENRNIAATSPTPQNSPTTDNTKELEEKLANLEKQIANQKTVNSPNPFPTEETPKERTARANSPSDGFLALRSLPSTATGERLAKIPHGTRFTVIDCPKPTNPGKIKGRWCRVIYDGIEGWAFDAYMIFD